MKSKGKVILWKDRFAIAKVKELPVEASFFALIVDRGEITVVIKEKHLPNIDVEKVEKGYRMFTFDMVLPFNMVGFLARISKALADAGVSIFVISSYSTDHLLVREEDLEKARKALEELGFIISEV